LRPPANPRVLGFAFMGGRNVAGRNTLGASFWGGYLFRILRHPWRKKQRQF
jgi:hypothetical protein